MQPSPGVACTDKTGTNMAPRTLPSEMKCSFVQTPPLETKTLAIEVKGSQLLQVLPVEAKTSKLTSEVVISVLPLEARTLTSEAKSSLIHGQAPLSLEGTRRYTPYEARAAAYESGCEDGNLLDWIESVLLCPA